MNGSYFNKSGHKAFILQSGDCGTITLLVLQYLYVESNRGKCTESSPLNLVDKTKIGNLLGYSAPDNYLIAQGNGRYEITCG